MLPLFGWNVHARCIPPLFLQSSLVYYFSYFCAMQHQTTTRRSSAAKPQRTTTTTTTIIPPSPLPPNKTPQPAAGSLEAVALSLAREVSGNPEDWERRRKALFAMQQAVDEAGKGLPEGGGGEKAKALFTPEVWRHLKEPLKHTLVRKNTVFFFCLFFFYFFCVCVLARERSGAVKREESRCVLCRRARCSPNLNARTFWRLRFSLYLSESLKNPR